MRIVFMGTPKFAAASLSALHEAGHEILAVYCQPDKPVGRGMKLAAPPVKEMALQLGLGVFQPTKLRDGVVAANLRELVPDAIIVVAYGRILPIEILEIPKYGCVNAHASLLPKYRGAAPIQWAVLNGDEKTGVTTMYMAEGCDTGDMILKKAIPVGERTSGELFEALEPIAAELLVETLAQIENGTAPRVPQDELQATHAPMLDKAMSLIDKTKTADEIAAQIRGLDPWPMATLELHGNIVKVSGAKVGDFPDCLHITAGDGQTVSIASIQAAGKRKMSAADYLRGVR